MSTGRDCEDESSTQLRRALVTAADQSSPCHRVLRHYDDRQVAVRPADFYQALKTVDEAVVRLQLEGIAPIDCRAHEDGIEFATDLYDEGAASRDDFLDKASKASTVSVIPEADSEFADVEDDQEVRADGGIKIQDICDEFVREQAVPADDAESWVHIGIDDHFHPAGGYWFPTGETWGDSSGWVSRKSKIPHGGIVQYPCSEKEPEVRGKDEVPNYVVNRTLSTETGNEVRTDGGTSADSTSRPGGAGECPQGCHHPVAGQDTLETREETVPIEPPEVFEVYGETVVQTERVRCYQACIVCGWVIDL